MLTITIQGEEFWDEDAEVFTYPDAKTLDFEHSLVSLSKWEAKYHKLFLTPDPKTDEEMLGYLRAMLLTPDVSDAVLLSLSAEDTKALDEYINDPMTGTTFSNIAPSSSRSSERISSELIYYWMSEFNIPMECQSWHLNRLFTRIKLHHVKTQKPQKMSKSARVSQMAELNAKRKAQMGTSG